MSFTTQQVAIIGGTISGVAISNLPAPVNPSDAATKSYVDSVIPPAFTPLTNSLIADVLLNNTALFFDGPQIAQGIVGTWFVSGHVTLTDTSIATMSIKLWDGTTVISSGVNSIFSASGFTVVALSGFLAAPAGNIRISVKDNTNTTGKILFNTSGTSKDSTISGYRIA